MHVGKIRIFATATKTRQRALNGLVESGRRLGLDCEVVGGTCYTPCDVAVVWGLSKQGEGEDRALQDRQRLRQDVLARHPGQLVVVEAPVLGRKVRPRSYRPWLVRKLFPASAPWTPYLLPASMYMHDSYEHYRIGLGSFPDEGGLALAPHCSGRWQGVAQRLGLSGLRPYRSHGRHILVIGQVPGDTSLRGADINAWLLRTAVELRRMTDRPVIVRPHPLARDEASEGLAARLAACGATLGDTGMPLAECLEDAWSVVTYSSGVAVDALLAGIPAVAMSPASFAWEVTDHDLSAALSPTLFEREAWLEKLAAAQWWADEIERGDIWAPLISALAAERPASIAA